MARGLIAAGAMAVGLVVAALIDLVQKAVLFRIQRGTFRVLIDMPDRLAFSTDLGQFQIRADRKKLMATSKDGQTLSIAPEEMDGLVYGWQSEWAFGYELLAGFDVWDFSARYMDRNNWYRIGAKLKSGKVLPIFLAGQWEPREPFLAPWFEFEARLLTRLGLFHSVEEVSLETLDRLRSRLADSGFPVHLT